MRILFTVILMVAFSWSAYWWIGAHGVEQATRNWLDQRAEAGWIANYETVETKGFPNRFDTTVTEIELAFAGSDASWQAPFLQLFRFSYQPNHIITVWPKTQTVNTPAQTITVTSESAQASFVFKPSTELELDRSALEITTLTLRSSNGWQAEIAKGILATRTSRRVAGAIDMAFDAQEIVATFAGLDPAHHPIQLMSFDASVTFDAPLTRGAIDGPRPQIDLLRLEAMQVNWGQLELVAAGDLTFDSLGRASGSITVKVRNWEELFHLAVARGWVSGSTELAVRSVLTGLADSESSFDVDLSLSQGTIFYGSFPLGTIPSFIIP